MKNRIKILLLCAITLHIPTHYFSINAIGPQEQIGLELDFSSKNGSLPEFLSNIITHMNLLLKNHVASPEEIAHIQTALDKASMQAEKKEQFDVQNLLNQAYTMLEQLKINLNLFYKTINKSGRRLKQDIVIIDKNFS